MSLKAEIAAYVAMAIVAIVAIMLGFGFIGP